MSLIPKGKFRIFIAIAVLFTGLITLFGIINTWFTYRQTSQLLLDDTQFYFNQIRQELTYNYRTVREKAAQTVHILAHTGITQTTALDQRLKHLPAFYSALKGEDKLTAIQVGYETGDYFIVRMSNSTFLKEQFNAPENAVLMVDNITSGASPDIRFWYDDHLGMLKEERLTNINYDPRTRPWYVGAVNSDTDIATEPYLFHFIRQMGFTVGFQVPDGSAVIAGDVTLYHLSQIIANHRITGGAELVLLEKLEEKLLVTAYQDPEELLLHAEPKKFRFSIKDLNSGVLNKALDEGILLNDLYEFEFDGKVWVGSARNLDLKEDDDKSYLVMVAPKDEILVGARKVQKKIIFVTLLLVLLACPLIWILARQLSTPMQHLARETERIEKLEFESGARFEGSVIKEVDELGNAMFSMEHTIDQFLSLLEKLSGEEDLDNLLERISGETMQIAGADGSFTYHYGPRFQTLIPSNIRTPEKTYSHEGILPTFDIADSLLLKKILDCGDYVTGSFNELVEGIDISSIPGLQNPLAAIFPLKNRNGKTIGTLFLLYDESNKDKFSSKVDRLPFINKFTAFGAVTLESMRMINELALMLKKQKELLLSFIDVLAEAIDSKSPYTGGHCKRVPIITLMIAAKACETVDGPFADYNLDEEQWEELNIACGLHDCGKVTTPEYIVDKATKLETIYNRIHEIRMRFEILKRDAHISWLQENCNLTTEEASFEQLRHYWAELDEEFAFVAACNEGDEPLTADDLDRLQAIASKTWTRTISDRIGISNDERERKERTVEKDLPAREQLLADLDEHYFYRDETTTFDDDNEYGFKLDTPEKLYNRGELYNLSVQRGTLTTEDRYAINDHIVQTIIMLNKLPFPDHLTNVPDIAGSHHERMDGTGYPRKLTRDQMPVEARMMVIADIFEALTASDRPYKKAKTLNQALTTMASMVNDKHIDPDLFELFVRHGVYLEYGREYLSPELIDDVDIESLLSKTTLHT